MNSIEESNAATVRRATKLARWYSPQWRERYGDEFIAHMEQELRDRPSDIGRTWNIACHGLLNRIENWSRVRFVASLSSLAAVIIAVSVFLASLSSVTSVRLTPGTKTGGVGGFGVTALPATITDLSFVFSTPTPVVVRVLSIKVISLPGFNTPKVIGVDFAPKQSILANATGWPLHFTAHDANVVGDAHPRPVIGKVVRLGLANTIWLGFRTPRANSAYAINGIVIRYERTGKVFTAVLSQTGWPDVICVRHNAMVRDLTCSGLFHAASSIAAAVDTTNPGAMAQSITFAALELQFALNHHYPALQSVERWAALVKPSRKPFGVQRITEVTEKSQRVFRFTMRRGASSSVQQICVVAQIQQNDSYSAADQPCS